MRGVNRDVIVEEHAYPTERSLLETLQPTPEHSVVNDQQVGVIRDGALDCGCGKVDGRRDSSYRSAVIYLNSVKCVRVVRCISGVE
jgi:hypothetical protein